MSEMTAQKRYHQKQAIMRVLEEVYEEEDTEDLTADIVDTRSVEDDIENRCLNDLINGVLDTISRRERDIIIMRYGLFGEEKKTLASIGIMYGLTKERIRQLCAKGKRRIHYRMLRQIKRYRSFL